MRYFLLSFLTYLLFIPITVIANDEEENRIAEQCRIEADEVGIPAELISQYIQDCLSQHSPWETEQQRLKRVTEECRIEADESGTLPEEIEQYIQNCISQQTPWSDDNFSGEDFGPDTDSDPGF